MIDTNIIKKKIKLNQMSFIIERHKVLNIVEAYVQKEKNAFGIKAVRGLRMLDDGSIKVYETTEPLYDNEFEAIIKFLNRLEDNGKRNEKEFMICLKSLVGIFGIERQDEIIMSLRKFQMDEIHLSTLLIFLTKLRS